jgi:RHS repeat-associated protein
VGISFGYSAIRAYFGGKLVAQLGSSGSLTAAIQDRLGSVGKYYPYGEERNSPQLLNDTVKFATYTRDSATGNDYADQRYYSSTLGRFMTPDPYQASGTRSSPQSWDRYSYVLGDPINSRDSSGLDIEVPDDPNDPSDPFGQSGPGATCDPFDASCNPCVGADGFTPMPGPFCPAVPVLAFAPPPPAATTKPPECEIDLYGQSAAFEGDPFLHTFLKVSYSYLGATITYNLEAGPSNGFGGFLNSLNDAPIAVPSTSPTPAPGGNFYPTTAADLATLAKGAGACTEVYKLLALAATYPDNKYQYDNPYNSNSFTYTLLKDAGVNIPVWLTFELEFFGPLGLPIAPGWGQVIPSWFSL